MARLTPGSSTRLLLALTVIFILVSIIGWLTGLVLPTLAAPVAVASATCILVYLMHRWHSHPAPGAATQAALDAQTAKLDRESRRLAALANLVPLLQDTYLLVGDFAMEPAALNELVAYVQVQRCTTIVECGSGVSTLVLGAILQQQGQGRLWAFEQNREWFEMMQVLVTHRNLSEHVQVIYAPLTPTRVNGITVDWYTDDAVDAVCREAGVIDLLLVDGPITTSDFSRYPALPKFIPFTKEDTLMVLDDAARSQEQAVLKRWESEYPIRVETHESGEREQAYITLTVR